MIDQWIHNVAVLAALGFCGLADLVAQEPKKELPLQYQRDFKGLAEKSPEWGFAGQDAAKFVTLGPEGVRITLPAREQGGQPEVGLVTKLLLRGDFAVTLRYEILTEPNADEAGTDQTRVTLGVLLAPPHADVATISRRVWRDGGTHFLSWMRAWDDVGKKRADRAFAIKAQAKTGRLRMARTGTALYYRAAEGDADEFRLVAKWPFGSEDVTEVRFVATTGGPQSAFDVRVTDLEIRAEAMPKSPTAPPPPVKLTPPEKEYAQEYFQSFKGKTDNVPGWEVLNPTGEQNVRFEAAGLRITLPPGREGGHPATGLSSGFGVQGDFEITLSFEIIKEADAGTNRSILDLAATKDVPKSDVTTIGRLMSPTDGRRFISWASMWNNAREKMVPDSISVPTKVMIGRLRLVRSGADVYYGFSDGFDGDFRYFKKLSFGAENVRRVRIAGSVGGDKGTFDVRVTDFRIRADAIPNMPASSPAPGAAVVAGPIALQSPLASGKGWLAVTLAGGIAVLLMAAVALGAVLYLRRRNITADASIPPVAFMSLTCPDCGKKLKVKPELVGKKVKCGQCGKGVPVPTDENL